MTKIIPALITGTVIGLVCLFAILSQVASSIDFFARMELITYDWRVRAAVERKPYASTNLGFVAITDDVIAEIANGFLDNKSYGLLWPRQIYGRLVNELSAQGATVIGFDVLLPEERPDQDGFGITQSNGVYMKSDEYFTNAMAKAGNVVLAATVDIIPADVFGSVAYSIADVSSDQDPDGILRRSKPFVDYRIWHPYFRGMYGVMDLKKNAKVYTDKVVVHGAKGEVLGEEKLDKEGNFTLPKRSADEPDVKARPYRDQRVWTMGIQLAAKGMGLDLNRTEVRPGALILHGANGLERVIPLDRNGDFYVDWNIRLGDRRIQVSDLHWPLFDGIEREKGTNIVNNWMNRIVLVGSTASGNNMADRGATPLQKDDFLPSKHWNVANSIIMDRFVHQTPLSVNLLLIVVLGVISGVVSWRLGIIPSTLFMILIGAVFVAVCWYGFVQHRLWIPIVFPAIGGLILPNITLVAYRVIFEEKEKRRVRSIFSRLVSPNVVNELLSTEKLALGGSRRHITVYFADVRGFTEMTDTIQVKAEEFVKQHNLTGDAAEAYFDKSAAETLETVNLYLATIADTIKARSGTLDKYIGDCVMAFWGAPTSNDRHALDCVLAAIDAQRAMYALNQRRFAENKRREEENKTRVANGEYPVSILPLLSLGSGINSGIAIVGMMGSEDHIINYTVFGREINLASRLEGLSGRGRIIIGETTYRELQRLDPELAKTCVELAPTMLKGFKQAVRNFEVPWKTAALAGSQPTPAPATPDKPAISPAPVVPTTSPVSAEPPVPAKEAGAVSGEPVQPEAAKS